MSKFVTKFLNDESGATAIEYGLIAALIAVVIITAVTALGSTIKTKFNAVVTGMGGTAGASRPPATPSQGRPRRKRRGLFLMSFAGPWLRSIHKVFELYSVAFT